MDFFAKCPTELLLLLSARCRLSQLSKMSGTKNLLLAYLNLKELGIYFFPRLSIFADGVTSFCLNLVMLLLPFTTNSQPVLPLSSPLFYVVCSSNVNNWGGFQRVMRRLPPANQIVLVSSLTVGVRT